MHPTSSPLLLVVFALLTVVVAGVVVMAIARARPAWGWRAAVVAVLWLAATAAVASTGRLLDFTARPPPFVLVFAATLGAALLLAVSRVGAVLSTLPMWMLVGFHGFRLPLELVMHRAAREGVMPQVMSFEGRNVDIVAGATAIVVAVLLKRGGSLKLAGAWVVLATVVLGNVVTIAVLASPLVRFFGDAELNTWIAYAPFIWLPTVLVAMAMAGQIVIVRALMSAR